MFPRTNSSRNEIGTHFKISESLQPIALQMLYSPEKWKKIADDYWHLWNVPLCLGAINSKHCII